MKPQSHLITHSKKILYCDIKEGGKKEKQAQKREHGV